MNGRLAKCAYAALKEEFCGFDFTSPYEVDVSAVGDESWRYPIFSNRLRWTALRMDSRGVACSWARTTGVRYWPGNVAWYGLHELGRFHRSGDARHLEAFLRQVDWLESAATETTGGSVEWRHFFDYPEDQIVLRSPWISSFAQGFVLSALVRAWRIRRTRRLSYLLERASSPFSKSVEHGGLRVTHGGHVFYTEVPGGLTPGILDGFLVSLIGLHDLSTVVPDDAVKVCLRDGMAGLVGLLPFWDYKRKWSWYGHHLHLCPPLYHHWNQALLQVLHAISNDDRIRDTARYWNTDRLSRIDRLEIYGQYLFTKNRSRVAARTWLLPSYFEENPTRIAISNERQAEALRRSIGSDSDRRASETGEGCG